MATVTHFGTATWSTTAGTGTTPTNGPFTPAAGDLLIVIAPSTGVATSTVTDNNADGRGAYTQIGSTFTGFSTSGDLTIWVRNSFVGSGTATTVTAPQNGSTGGGADVYRVSGMTRSGLVAIRSSGGQSTGGAGTTPAPVLSQAPLTGNVIITAVCNGTSPAGVTIPTGYTAAPTNLGYATPTTGLTDTFVNSGITNATITWGSTSATAFASIAVELDTSAPPSGPVFVPQSARQAVRAKLPARLANYAGNALGYGGVRQNVAPQVPVPFTRVTSSQYASGRISSSAGAPVQNPTSGPPLGWSTAAGIRGFLLGAGSAIASHVSPPNNPTSGPPLSWGGPAGLRVTVLRAGSAMASSQISPFPPVVSQAAPFFPATQPVQAKRPLPPRGRVYSNPGAPLQNPTSGPVFQQANQPAQSPIPRNGPRGRVYSNPGTIFIPPAAQVAPFYPKQAIRARFPQQPFLRGRVYSNNGASLRNPTSGPPFIQKPWPVQATDPLPKRGRVYVTPVQVPGPVALFRQAVKPVRAVIPQTWSKGRVYSGAGAPVRNATSGPPLNTFLARPRIPQNAPRGRVYSNPGAPLRNPVAGPFFRQLPWPVQAVDPLPRRGRVYSNPGAPVNNPVFGLGPAFFPFRFPARARVPQNAPRGRIYSNAGAPVRNPSSGPVFVQANRPIQARRPLPPRGRTASNTGTLLIPPPFTIGPPFYQATAPIRARIPQNAPRGRVYGNQGAPVHNPVSGPPIHTSLVRSRIPQNGPRGRVYANPGAFFPSTGPQFRQATQPIRSRILQTWSKGRVYSGAGTFSLSHGPVFRQATSPARARIPQNGPRGRVYSGKGAPLPVPFVAAVFYPLGHPVQPRKPLPPKGRTYSNPGAPVRNPTQGPRFIQAVQPARTRIPQNAPRGRTSGNPGAPVHNIPLSAPFIKIGVPYLEWIVGQPHNEWKAGEPFPYSDWSTGEPFLDWLTGVPYQEWDTGEPYGS